MIQLTDNLRINKNAPVDDRLGVFATTAEALSSIVSDRRYLGLTVLIEDAGSAVEYWFENGITDSDLTVKHVGSQQVNSDWNATSGVAQILNKPTIPTASDFIEDAINNGITNKAPSENAVYDALALKFNNPTGTTAQYLDGTGAPIDFPTAGQAGTLVRQVRNETGATLTKGTVVYISGASGNKALVSKAIATSDATSAQTFGIVQADITTNQNGYVVIRGDLSGLDTSSYAEGAQLYLSGTTAGTFTSTKQYAPIHLVYVGIVTRSHVNQGSIEVAIQNGYELDELHNVQAQSPSNKNSIFFDSADNQWKARAVNATDIDANVSNTEFGYLDGVTSSIQTQLNGKQASLGYTPENVANKQTDLTASATNYPTVNAVNTGLATKEPTITAGTTAQYWRGDKSWQTLNSTAVGLGNCNNTSDANKPISTATQTALNNITTLFQDVSQLTTTSTTSATLTSFTVASSSIPVGGVIRIVGIVERTAGTGSTFLGININSAGAKYFQSAGQSMQFEILIGKMTSTTVRYGQGPSNTGNASYNVHNLATTSATQDGSGNFVISVLGFVGTSGATLTLQFIKGNLL